MVKGSNENLQSRENTEWGLPDPYKKKNQNFPKLIKEP